MFSNDTKYLNTPRQVYDDQQQLKWKWDQAEPFGVNTPDENPLNLGAFEMPLRFPGQYADKETNQNYNYFRDYDPSIGRYRESDPIGLRGGIHTYTYVSANPLGLSDRLGNQTPNPFINFLLKRLLSKVLGDMGQDPMDKGAEHERAQLKLMLERELEMCIQGCIQRASCLASGFDTEVKCSEDCRLQNQRRLDQLW